MGRNSNDHADPVQPRDTGEAILSAAFAEFTRREYYATSIQTIARRVGITKTAVLYHFPEKADLLSALASPLLNDVERVLRDVEDAPTREGRWRVIEGILDTWIAHRTLLRMSLKDMALPAAQPVFETFRDFMLRANALIARKRPSFAARVRLSDPDARRQPVDARRREPGSAVSALQRPLRGTGRQRHGSEN